LAFCYTVKTFTNQNHDEVYLKLILHHSFIIILFATMSAAVQKNFHLNCTVTLILLDPTYFVLTGSSRVSFVLIRMTICLLIYKHYVNGRRVFAALISLVSSTLSSISFSLSQHLKSGYHILMKINTTNSLSSLEVVNIGLGHLSMICARCVTISLLWIFTLPLLLNDDINQCVQTILEYSFSDYPKGRKKLV
ncbi:hypothetical protein L9F63_013771, partial [Diploptera punctata]